MAERAAEMEFDCHTAWDDDHFESDFDDSVSSTDDKQDRSDTEGGQQTSGAVDHAEMLSDRQVQDAVNKLLKVGIRITLILFEQHLFSLVNN